MRIVEAKDPSALLGALLYLDLIIFACQSMWHLKDWLFNDPHFGAKNRDALMKDIHAERCLSICADLANGAKHLVLHSPKTGFRFAEDAGIHINAKNGVFQEFYYVVGPDPSDPFDGMEIRELLSKCREAWEAIINRHYLTDVDPT